MKLGGAWCWEWKLGDGRVCPRRDGADGLGAVKDGKPAKGMTQWGLFKAVCVLLVLDKRAENSLPSCPEQENGRA